MYTKTTMSEVSLNSLNEGAIVDFNGKQYVVVMFEGVKKLKAVEPKPSESSIQRHSVHSSESSSVQTGGSSHHDDTMKLLEDIKTRLGRLEEQLSDFLTCPQKIGELFDKVEKLSKQCV